MTFMRSELFHAHGINAVFSQRAGGVSSAPFDSLNLGLGLGDSDEHVRVNLAHLCSDAGFPVPHRSVQTHGTNVLLCRGDGTQHTSEADILITSSPLSAVAVRTADCLPILLADRESGIAAAVHAGWRGTAQSVVQKAVDAMQQLGA